MVVVRFLPVRSCLGELLFGGLIRFFFFFSARCLHVISVTSWTIHKSDNTASRSLNDVFVVLSRLEARLEAIFSLGLTSVSKPFCACSPQSRPSCLCLCLGTERVNFDLLT